MKIDTFRRATKADFPEIEERFIEKNNRDIERLHTAVQGRLTPDENFNTDTVALKLADDVETTARVELNGRPTRARVVATPGYYNYLPLLAWKTLAENEVTVKVKWQESAPTEKQLVHIEFGGG